MTAYLPNITNLMSWEAMRHYGRWSSFEETKEGRDGAGAVALVSGGNGAMGQRISEVLFTRGYKVYLASRDIKRGQEAIDAIKRRAPNGVGKLELLHLDLADLSSVRRAAADFQARESKLHLLVNNGGVMVSADGKISPDGVEYMMATNCLGPYHLTQLLVPALHSAAASSPSYSVRVVNVSSLVHAQAPGSGIDFSTLEKPTKNIMTITGSLPYNQSKLGDIIWTHALAKQLDASGILVLSCHPGIIKSPLWDGSSALRRFLFMPVMLSPTVGARTPLYCALSPNITDKHNGGYYIPVGKQGKPLHPMASDAQLEAELCEWMDAKTALDQE